MDDLYVGCLWINTLPRIPAQFSAVSRSAAGRADSPSKQEGWDPEKNPEEVKVLRGNPHQVAAVADTLQFEHKYTSGVIEGKAR